MVPTLATFTACQRLFFKIVALCFFVSSRRIHGRAPSPPTNRPVRVLQHVDIIFKAWTIKNAATLDLQRKTSSGVHVKHVVMAILEHCCLRASVGGARTSSFDPLGSSSLGFAQTTEYIVPSVSYEVYDIFLRIQQQE